MTISSKRKELQICAFFSFKTLIPLFKLCYLVNCFSVHDILGSAFENMICMYYSKYIMNETYGFYIASR